MTDELDVSERRACRVVGQHRSTQRRLPTPRSDQENLTQAVINLAEKYGRYGYRRITALLNREGWRVSVGVTAELSGYNLAVGFDQDLQPTVGVDYDLGGLKLYGKYDAGDEGGSVGATLSF